MAVGVTERHHPVAAGKSGKVAGYRRVVFEVARHAVSVSLPQHLVGLHQAAEQVEGVGSVSTVRDGIVGAETALDLAANVDELGGFDAATFGRGYGEENDFCLRAAAMGWRNVLCETAYVVHLGNASFGPLDMAPNGDNLGRLLARWPDYNERVARFIMADPLRPHRQRLQENLEKLARSGPQRDLFG